MKITNRDELQVALKIHRDDCNDSYADPRITERKILDALFPTPESEYLQDLRYFHNIYLCAAGNRQHKALLKCLEAAIKEEEAK